MAIKIGLDQLLNKLSAIRLDRKEHHRTVYAHMLAYIFRSPVNAEAFLNVAISQTYELEEGEDIRPLDQRDYHESLLNQKKETYERLRDNIPWIATQISPVFGEEVKAAYEKMKSINPEETKVPP